MFEGDSESLAIQLHGVRGQTNYEQSSRETPNTVNDVKPERGVINQALKKKRQTLHGNLETQYDDTPTKRNKDSIYDYQCTCFRFVMKMD